MLTIGNAAGLHMQCIIVGLSGASFLRPCKPSFLINARATWYVQFYVHNRHINELTETAVACCKTSQNSPRGSMHIMAPPSWCIKGYHYTLTLTDGSTRYLEVEGEAWPGWVGILYIAGTVLNNKATLANRRSVYPLHGTNIFLCYEVANVKSITSKSFSAKINQNASWYEQINALLPPTVTYIHSVSLFVVFMPVLLCWLLMGVRLAMAWCFSSLSYAYVCMHFLFQAARSIKSKQANKQMLPFCGK